MKTPLSKINQLLQGAQAKGSRPVLGTGGFGETALEAVLSRHNPDGDDDDVQPLLNTVGREVLCTFIYVSTLGQIMDHLARTHVSSAKDKEGNSEAASVDVNGMLDQLMQSSDRAGKGHAAMTFLCTFAILWEFFESIGCDPAAAMPSYSNPLPRPKASARMRKLVRAPDSAMSTQDQLAYLRREALAIVPLLRDAAIDAGNLQAQQIAGSNYGETVAVGLLLTALDVGPKDGRRRTLREQNPDRLALTWRGGPPRKPAAPSPRNQPAPQSTSSVRDWQHRTALLEGEVAGLKKALAETQKDSDDEMVIMQYADHLRALRSRLHWLENRPLPGAPTPMPQRIVSPSSWEDLWPFVEQQMGGRLLVTRKAMRTATSSLYEDVPFACQVLQMLAEEYVPMRRGEEGAKMRYEAACGRLGVTVGPVGEAAFNHRHKAAYQTRHLGQFITLDLHVQGSSSRDPREGFRVYFAYVAPDDGFGYVVVGHLPTHLDNTLS